MGRHQSDYIRALFPNEVAIGVDLGNIEIKESRNGFHQFTVLPKDMFAEFFLFYDWQFEEFYFCDVQDLPEVKKKRSFTTIQVEKFCLWKTKDEIELLTNVEKVMKFE